MNKTGVSPFTMTPGIAGNALIQTHFSDEIIMNFETDQSCKYVYKIVGLRGSGKSVEYSHVVNYFRKRDKWLAYALSAGGNPVQTLISEMLGLSADAGINTSVNISENPKYYSDEAELKEMIKKAAKMGYHILIGIDDIAKTDEMIRFLSILGTILMEPEQNVRFICTGLSKNIEDFVNVPHLSFFVRNESIKMKPLEPHSMTQKYRQLLGISREDAINLARFTKGYAYGYQVLGELCFKNGKSVIDENLAEDFDDAIGPQYDLIWSTLTDAEQELVRIIVNLDSGSVAEIKDKMGKESGFASLRDRLLKKHVLISATRGSVEVPLPRFKEYVNTWH